MQWYSKILLIWHEPKMATTTPNWSLIYLYDLVKELFIKTNLILYSFIFLI